MRLKALRAVVLPALLLALLGGCATRPPTDRADTEAETTARAEEKARRMLEAGRPLAAVRVFRDLAEQAEPDRAQQWRLRIVELLFDEGYPELAVEWHRKLDERPVPSELRTRKQIVDARAAVAERQGVRALRLLPSTDSSMEPALRARILAVRADAYGMTGQPGPALTTRIEREALLETETARAANHEAIWSLLRGLPADRLRQLADRSDAPVLNGWAELALRMRHARMGEAPVSGVLDDWRGRFPDHPAAARFVATLRDRVTAELAYPDRIALLLPLSGRLAGPARAIRDGLMAAYYDQPDSVSRPRIAVYDTGEEGLSADAAYDRAVTEGAEFVIGPLAKPAVGELAARDRLEVPVLSLNYVPDQADAEGTPSNLTQFGLLPEDEARQSAEAALQNEHFNSLALVPAGSWGGRMLDAFSTRFEELGGVVLETAQYNSEASDYGRPIQRLLNLDRSHARERRLQSTIGREVRFEPRRRQDVEMIFLAAMPQQARLLEPQLEFHRAGNVPAYATSHVFSGVPAPDEDWDLNGLFFTDLPWILDHLDQPEGLYRDVVEHWPQARENYPRLYPLGIDAFALIPHLKRLDESEYAAMNGHTGRLTLDDAGRIHRQLRWATFVKGRPVPVLHPGAGAAEDAHSGDDVRSRAEDPDS